MANKRNDEREPNIAAQILAHLLSAELLLRSTMLTPGEFQELHKTTANIFNLAMQRIEVKRA